MIDNKFVELARLIAVDAAASLAKQKAIFAHNLASDLLQQAAQASAVAGDSIKKEVLRLRGITEEGYVPVVGV